MECNKEEALRAKSIAESKMLMKDFEGAQKIALKAQLLFPELESISQILAVCEVHCAAATKIAGGTDWYAILQVEMTADESTIKKQFRKLALLLHPDKNKLAGAESAFQQIGNAYKILSDPAKRSQHDMLRRTNFSGVILNQATRQTYRPAKKQPGPGVSSFAHFNGLNHDQPYPFSRTETFWTKCSSCSVRFLYHQNNMNKKVKCKKCFHIFAAYDLKMPGKSTEGNSEKDGNSAPVSVAKSDDANASTMEFQRARPKDSVVNQGTNLEDVPEFFGESIADTSIGKAEDDFINSNEIKFQKVQLRPIREKVGKPLANQKRSRNEENQNAETSVDGNSKFLRRSNRHKPNVPCNEVQGASVDSRPPSKRSRPGGKQVNAGQTNSTFPPVISDSGNSQIHSESNASLSPGCNSSVDPKNLSYPAPEFFNFDSERNESKFAVDQIWALYDDIDGMPRFYARVKKVYSREFKLQLCWLENHPNTIAEMQWSEQGLPVACGGFKLGKTFVTHDRQTFSHLVSWSKGERRNPYTIYPRKGEIWALFSKWNIRWSSEPDKHRVRKFQVVEVVSDFAVVTGISVVPLIRIKEFMSLFVRAAGDEEILLEIPAKDVLMFSHRIPACRMTGKEEDGVPEGSFELDCASLPSNFNTIFPSISIDVRKSRMPNVDATFNNICTENTTSLPTMGNGFEPSERNATDKPRLGMSLSPSHKINGASESENATSKNEFGTEVLLSFEYPESEFYDFESDRQMSKFESGQIWAFYCEIDYFPKYYGQIRSVDPKNSQVHVRWLAASSASEEGDRCAVDKPPPPACGVFSAIKESCTMDSGESFSYLTKAKPMPMKGHYYIFPEVGEIWAVFRNWSADSSAIELRNGEFDIVEISSRGTSEVKALLLVKVSDYISVFRRKSDAFMSISCNESARFSHRIPAHRLTQEMGSADFWELDPAAVPVVFLTPKT
ncbi:hypothetical protein KSP40_PGU019081 [Platanthera guangdongensis]|uniref:J domain-containing protein n=1 Tax=Platanthera guangdongensis TaxID=2320717 RepID=A0ABR2MPK1_9ASPA